MNSITDRISEIENIIYSYLPEEVGYQSTVLKAMNYTMKAGGKRIRPMLMEETYKLFGGSDRKIIEPFMAAIEMIHTYSLIHDDLPALDNDDYRRGRKTAHVVYGEAMAILAGDGLLNYAFEVASKAFVNNEGDAKVARAFMVLTRKPGIYGMIGGQVTDIELTGTTINNEQVEYIYNNKTGALIEAAMMIGALLAGASSDEVKVIEQIANDIGMAFQIQDDILDIVGDEKALGKPIHSDEDNNKMTYATIHGIDKAKSDVELISKRAIDNMDNLPYKNEFLRDMILYLISREK